MRTGRLARHAPARRTLSLRSRPPVPERRQGRCSRSSSLDRRVDVPRAQYADLARTDGAAAWGAEVVLGFLTFALQTSALGRTRARSVHGNRRDTAMLEPGAASGVTCAVTSRASRRA